jgi:hypothetical protein
MSADPSPLERELSRLIDANALGRSNTYQKLLEYLIQRTLAEAPPREMEIAIDVFGRKADFDPAADPFVRVYVHNLRKKLHAWYRDHAGEGTERLEIPPGAYRVEMKREELPVPLAFEPAPMRGKPRWQIAAVMGVLVAFVLGWWLGAARTTPMSAAEAPAIWKPLLDSKRPTIVALGDLFVFQEREPKTGANRMVRETSINSSADLDQRYPDAAQASVRYYNEGVAAALYYLRSLPRFGERSIEIKPASRLSAHDLRENDVIFIGLYKTLGPLLSVFNASHFEANANFTRLTNRQTAETFEIQGDPVGRHTDYGLFSRLAGPDGNTIFVYAGFTDTSLLQMAKTMSGAKASLELQQGVFKGEIPDSFEILFEASGVDRNDISSRILRAWPLDSRAAWGR